MAGQKATTSAKFPKFIKEEMKYAAGEARGLYNDPTKSTLPGRNQWTTQGIADRAAIAGGGNTVGSAGASEAQKVLSGGYLDLSQNPSFQRNMGLAMGAASDRFAGSGRVGSGSYAGALGDAATGVAGQMYNAERDRMAGALNNLPQLIASQYADGAALEEAGRATDERTMAEFDWPYAKLDRFANTVYGSPSAQMPGQESNKPWSWGTFTTGLLHPLSSGSS